MSLRKALIAGFVVIVILALVWIVSPFGGKNTEISDGGSAIAASGDSEEAKKTEESSVEIIDSGFGQAGNVTTAIVVVKADGADTVSKFVTASVNFLNDSGEILATEEQTEILSWDGQELALPVKWYLTDSNKPVVAEIQASVSVSEYGTGNPEQEKLPILESTEISTGVLPDTFTASFGLTNDTDVDMKDLRIGIACYDDEEEINGGGYDFPTLLAKGSTIRIDAIIETSGQPVSCKAYPNH